MTMGTAGDIIVSLPSGPATARVMTARSILKNQRGGQYPRPRPRGVGATKVEIRHLSRAAQTLHVPDPVAGREDGCGGDEFWGGAAHRDRAGGSGCVRGTRIVARGFRNLSTGRSGRRSVRRD